MTRKVGNEGFTVTTGEDGLKWNLERRKVDSATGETVRGNPQSSDGGAAAAGGLKEMFNATNRSGTAEPLGRRDVAEALRPAGSGKTPADTPKSGGEVSKDSAAAKEAVRVLGQLTKGSPAQRPEGVRQPVGAEANLGNQANSERAGRAAGQPGATHAEAQVSSMLAGLQGAKPTVQKPVGEEKRGVDPERPQVPTGRATTAEERGAVTQKDTAEAGLKPDQHAQAQAGQAAVGAKGAEKREQLARKETDTKEDKDGEDRELSPHSQQVAAHKTLKKTLAGQGGLGSSTTSDGPAYEASADGVETSSADRAERLGVTVLCEETKATEVFLAALEYRTDIEQPQKVIPNPEDFTLKQLGEMVIVTTEKTLDLATQYINARRSVGHGSPIGKDKIFA